METITEELNILSNVMFSPAFPCNPIPFANGIIQGIKDNGTDWITSEQAKRILYILIAQSYGQGFNIESYQEYTNLLPDCPKE